MIRLTAASQQSRLLFILLPPGDERVERRAGNRSEEVEGNQSFFFHSRYLAPITETVKQGTYERDPNTGRFRDEDIARILRDSTNDVAGAFGAHHTPAVMRWIDCQGMRTARCEKEMAQIKQ
jgi:hypothetical protein